MLTTTKIHTNQQRYDLTRTSKIELYSFNERAFTIRLQLCAPLPPFLPRRPPPTVNVNVKACHCRRRFCSPVWRRDCTMVSGQHLPADCVLIWYCFIINYSRRINGNIIIMVITKNMK